MNKAFIFDVDGTLAEKCERNPYNFEDVDKDSVKESVSTLLNALKKSGYVILIVSGRDDSCKRLTADWLNTHGIWWDRLYFRKTGDKRPDTQIKKEIYNNEIKDNYDVIGVFEDRDRVVKMWRQLGLQCYQVDYGDF